MSTAGKVLVVLVLLVAPIWVILFSGVAELNKSGTAQIDASKKQIANLENQVSKIEKDIAKLKDDIALEQEKMAEQLAVMRSHQADLQQARSSTAEIAASVKYQVAAMQEAAKRAEATRDLRGTEKTQEIAAKAAAEAEVEKLKQEHATLAEQLDKLRSDFKNTVDTNRRKLLEMRAKPTRSS